MVEIGQIKIVKDDETDQVYCMVDKSNKPYTYKVGPVNEEINFIALGLSVRVLISQRDDGNGKGK